jgi:hypothetical protein
MKRFRINEKNDVHLLVRHKGELILRTVYESGFSSISQAANYAKNLLDWRHKNKGYRIEITIHNLETGQSKYINTFS